MTDQQIDEFLEMLAKSPTSARDMVRGLFAAHEEKAEPFGYFRAEPLGWADCAATDEGAIALYERPAAPAVPQVWFNLLAEARNEAYDEEGYVMAPCLASAVGDIDAMLAATPAAPSQEPEDCRKRPRCGLDDPCAWVAKREPSQPVTLTDEEICECFGIDGADDWVFKGAHAIIAALREKEGRA